ncbi:MAG: alpha/beta hydrolase [Dorea formicigenerans]
MTACGNKESETVTPDNSTTPEAVETQPTQEATGTEETTSRDDTGVYPNATGLTEVAMGVTEDICTFKAFFISPIVNMEKLIADMMIWANVTEQDLYKEKEIETSFGETLSWEYLCYVREHPVVWNIPTKILYGDKDNLTSYETMSDFASKMGISLTVMNNGEHWFHTDEQMNFLDDWICESNR